MAQFNLKTFQRKAVEELAAQFKALWLNNSHGHELVFKSPTGSGKTVMVSNFINSLNGCADWSDDVAFVWITFSEDLAMQSKEKFADYFFPNISNALLTVQDFKQGILERNDILFLNWQKLVSRKASDRVLRRPEDDRLLKEQGYYFEDVVENTHAAGREIVMIIDESHKNVTEASMRDVIGPLEPKIILKVSATPERIPDASEIRNNRAEYVEVDRQDVIDAGLIKEEIISQTEEDLNVFDNVDNDILLLDLAMEKREILKEEWQRIGQNINPLVLIQVPDDEKKLLETGVKTKEQIVSDYLAKKGVNPRHIAKWFDNKKENLENITALDSPVEFMLFKYAAGTGWDCPRAQILVMYREIQSDTFRTQTLGRILRNPVPDVDLSNYPTLRIGYLYTNYRRNEVQNPHTQGENKPKTEVSKLRTPQLLQFATGQFVEDVVTTIQQTIGFEEEKTTKVQEVLRQVLPEAQSKSAEIAQIARTETDYHKRKEAIENKSNELKEKVQESLGDLFSGYGDVVGTGQATEEIMSFVQQLTATAAGYRDTDMVIDPVLKSDFQSRGDYGDVGRVSDFQTSFLNSMNRYFGVDPQVILSIDQQKDLLRKNGIDPNPYLERDVLVNARFINYDNDVDNDSGNTVKQEVSDNDAEKEFAWKCYVTLGEQTEDNAKIGNIARSWGPFKEAMRQWFKIALPSYTDVQRYKIFLRDLNKGESSVFKRAITQALIDYLPLRDKTLEAKMRKLAEQSATTFVIKSQYAFTDDMKEFSPSALSIVQPFRLLEKYKGRDNEVDFIKYLEHNADKIEWWFKNGTGKEALGFKYTDSTKDKDRIFYPDWLVKFRNYEKGKGLLGIFDTKDGDTETSNETKDKAEALQCKLHELNKESNRFRYVGGIVAKRDGLWYFNHKDTYIPIEKNRSDWTDFAELLK